MTKEENQYLYHYTTLDAFASIVEKREFWATNVFYLNDTAEFHLAVELAKKLLKDDIDGEKDATRRRRLEDVRRLLDDVRPGTTVKPCCFVCSFSASGDDLNQWRAYCQHGGIALGFRRDDLQRMIRDPSDPGYVLQYEGLTPQLVPCVYREQEQREVVRKCLEWSLGSRKGAKLVPPQQEDDYRAKLLKYMLVERPIKHRDFEPKQEWRLMLSPDWGMLDKGHERLKSRVRNGLLVPYWIVKLPSNGKGVW